MRKPDTTAVCGDDFVVQVISDPSEFARMGEEWDRLAAVLGDRSLFCSHAWISTAWRHRHEKQRGRGMYIVIVRQRDQLVLAAPFVRASERLGSAKLVALDSLTPQYNDILVTDDERRPAVEAAFRRYFRRSHRIRAISLNGVRADSATARMLCTFGAKKTWETVAQAVDLSPFPDGRTFFEKRSSKTRYSFRRYLRLLGRNGEVRFRRIDTAPEVEQAVRWIFTNKEKWVEEKFGAPNWIAAEGTADFFADISVLEASRGGAFVMQLELDRAPISATLAFRRHNTTFVSKMTYDPAWRAVSPGWLVTMNILMDACDRGDRSADLMIGSDGWKDRLGGQAVPVANYRLSNRLFSF